jgi:hypothetical protein
MVCTEVVKGAKFETPEGAYEVVCASAKNVVAILTTADGQRTMTRVPRGKFDATVRNGLSAGIPAVVEIPNVRTETDRYARMMMHDAMLYGTDRPLNRWALVWAIVSILLGICYLNLHRETTWTREKLDRIFQAGAKDPAVRSLLNRVDRERLEYYQSLKADEDQ